MLRESTAAGSIHGTMDLMQTNGTEMLLRTATRWGYDHNRHGRSVVSAVLGADHPGRQPGHRREFARTARRWTTAGDRPDDHDGFDHQRLVSRVTAHDNSRSSTPRRIDNVAITTPPTAVADSYATNEDTTLTVAAAGVLANDTDPESNALTAVLVVGHDRA